MRRSSALTAATLVLVLVLTACGDARLKNLTIGMARESVDIVMETPTPHRSETYLTEGHLWHVLMYSQDETAADSIAWRELSPVVLSDGKVTGWGWDWWEKKAAELRIAVPADE